MRYVLMVFLLITTSAFPQDTGDDTRIGTASVSATREGHTTKVVFTYDKELSNNNLTIVSG